MKPILRLFVAVFFLLSVTGLYSDVPKHTDMDKNLISTWNKTFPVPFTKIVKRDLSGKGVLLFKKSPQKKIYIYSYSVFLPLYGEEAEKPIKKEGGREIKVKLLYDPNSNAEKFTIELGEMDEAYDTRGIVKWIR